MILHRKQTMCLHFPQKRKASFPFSSSKLFTAETRALSAMLQDREANIWSAISGVTYQPLKVIVLTRNEFNFNMCFVKVSNAPFKNIDYGISRKNRFKYNEAKAFQERWHLNSTLYLTHWNPTV